jgi:hypothetical protein
VNRHLDRRHHIPALVAVQVIGSTALGGNKSLACFVSAAVAAVVVLEAELAVGVGHVTAAAVAAVIAGFAPAVVSGLEAVVSESLVPVPEPEPG